MALDDPQTVSTEMSFFLAMTLHPEIQHRAQAEIDRLTEGKRLVSYADLKHLPFVNAIAKEALRWAPVIPGGSSYRYQSL